MKILQKIFKNIQQKNKLDLITELLTIQTSTPDAMELFEKVRENFTFEMAKREKKASYDCRLINSFNKEQTQEKKTNKIKIY